MKQPTKPHDEHLKGMVDYILNGITTPRDKACYEQGYAQALEDVKKVIDDLYNEGKTRRSMFRPVTEGALLVLEELKQQLAKLSHSQQCVPKKSSVSKPADTNIPKENK